MKNGIEEFDNETIMAARAMVHYLESAEYKNKPVKEAIYNPSAELEELHAMQPYITSANNLIYDTEKSEDND